MLHSFCKIKSALCMFLLAWGLPMFNHVSAQESESEFIFIDGEKWHLLDCQVKATATIQDERKEFPRLADDVKRKLQEIKPWQVFRINGQLVNGDWDGGGYNIPIRLH